MISSRPLGDLLLAKGEAAPDEVILCAPFIKRGAIERLLRQIGVRGAGLTIYTRWRPEEVASGVSDVEVFELVRELGGSLRLIDHLHAKYYRFGDRTMVGSPNLTATALGWSAAPNLELLIELPAETPELVALEQTLASDHVEATPEIAAAVKSAAAELEINTLCAEQDSGEVVSAFFPTLREPKDLYRAYDLGVDALSRSSSDAARRDLSGLELPPNLGRRAFEKIVGTRLLQSPMIMAIDQLLVEQQRFGTVRDALREELGIDAASASRSWQTLMRWLLEFLPDRYERSVPNHSELLVRTR